MELSKEEYIKIQKDLSGSVAQNRFKFQRYWAINKIYELYEKEKGNFIVIFDFACDIDIFVNDNWHFYQVKSDNANKFTTKKLINIKKGKKHSIISRLALLDNKNIKTLNIVTNTYLPRKETNNKELKIICLKELSLESQNLIKKHLIEHINLIPDLSKYFYIKSDLCLNSSELTLLAYTIKFLKRRNMDISVNQAEHFLNYIINLSEQKSTCEQNMNDFDDISKNKGITRKDFTEILQTLDSINNNIIKKVEKIIDRYKTSFEKKNLSIALRNLTGSENGLKSLRHKNTLKKIKEYILNNEKTLVEMNTLQLIDKLEKDLILDSAYDQHEKKCLCIIGVIIFENGGTNEFNN